MCVRLGRLFGKSKSLNRSQEILARRATTYEAIPETTDYELMVNLANDRERANTLVRRLADNSETAETFTLTAAQSNHARVTIYSTGGTLWVEADRNTATPASSVVSQQTLTLSRHWGAPWVTKAGVVEFQEGFTVKAECHLEADHLVRLSIETMLYGYLREWSEEEDEPATLHPGAEFEADPVVILALIHSDPDESRGSLERLLQYWAATYVPDMYGELEDIVWLDSDYLREAFDFDAEGPTEDAVRAWVRHVLEHPAGEDHTAARQEEI